MEIIDVLSSKDITDAGGLMFANYHYLHGDIESWAGYDCVYVNKIPEKDGMFPCIVRKKDSDETKFAYWFKWTDRFNEVHGLIVEQTDTYSLDFAMNSYLNKKTHI